MTKPDPARSRTMRAVKSTDTKPEMLVRRLAHRLGYRFRLHRKDLPGSPDLVFPGRRRVIFVHGCFWHGHHCKRGARPPKTNAEYWRAKIARNRARDERVIGELEAIGWRSMTIWECELRDEDALSLRLRRYLEQDVFP
ncbi:MAG: DNA mismatch endonuclease Vsr [Sphingobium sp.]|nr:DNA mismatch endonuclease Vsr [Sphingobium sp.]